MCRVQLCQWESEWMLKTKKWSRWWPGAEYFHLGSINSRKKNHFDYCSFFLHSLHLTALHWPWEVENGQETRGKKARLKEESWTSQRQKKKYQHRTLRQRKNLPRSTENWRSGFSWLVSYNLKFILWSSDPSCGQGPYLKLLF